MYPQHHYWGLGSHGRREETNSDADAILSSRPDTLLACQRIGSEERRRPCHPRRRAVWLLYAPSPSPCAARPAAGCFHIAVPPRHEHGRPHQGQGQGRRQRGGGATRGGGSGSSGEVQRGGAAGARIDKYRSKRNFQKKITVSLSLCVCVYKYRERVFVSVSSCCFLY
jgi:hypothetical protein